MFNTILGRAEPVVATLTTSLGVALSAAAVVMGVNLIWTLGQYTQGLIH